MTVAGLLSQVSSSELSEWIALHDIEAAERAEAEQRQARGRQ